MKKILLVLFFALAAHSYAQLLLTEDFTGLTVGTLAGQSSWVLGTGTGVTVANTTPMTYTGYNGGGGEYIAMPAGSATKARESKSFATPVTAYTGQTFYYSFLMRLSATSATSVGYFFTLGDATGSSAALSPKLYATTNGAGYNLGVSKQTTTTANISWGSTVYNLNQTYLVVVKYVFHAAGTVAPALYDDECYVWVNPDLSAEPTVATAECKIVGGATTDPDFDGYQAIAGGVGSVVYNNRGVTNPTGDLDAIRVAVGADGATAWTNLAAKQASSGINVKFQANMSVLMKKGAFTEGSDSLVMRGNFQVDAGDVGDWQGYKFKFKPVSPGDTMYALTVTFPASSVGKDYQYKFVKNDTWETNQPTASTNREFKLAASDMVIWPGFFNNDSIYIPKPQVKMTVNFTADMTTLLGSGLGYFDAQTDSIQVMGLDWNGQVMINPVNRTLKADQLSPTLYMGQLTVQSTFGDTAEWKFKAFPDARYINNGWENSANHKIAFPTKDSTVNLLPMIPDIKAVQGTLASDVNVLFQVDMNSSPVNAKTNKPILLSNIDWMGVKGGSIPIGNWLGSWVAADTAVTTTAASMIVLNDAGVNGDLKAGDHIYSRNILFPTGTNSGDVPYKFGCSDKGSDTGATYLDNEAPSEKNHSFKLAVPSVGNQITLYNKFGDQINSIEVTPKSKNARTFELAQNYPNPFNPTTKISFAIPQDGMVTLKVYNVLGKEVSTLLNQNMRTGTYDVSFDASQLTTGVYLYRLSVGNFSSVKKMMLVK